MNKLKENQFKFKGKIYNRLNVKQTIEIYKAVNEPIIEEVKTFWFFKKKIVSNPTDEEKNWKIAMFVEKMYPEINNFTRTELQHFLAELTK